MKAIARHRLAFAVLGAALLLVAALLIAALLAVRPVSEVMSFDDVRDAWTPSEAYLLDRQGEVIDSVRTDFGVRRLAWVPLDAVSVALVTAVVDGEDRRFWKHAGVDWLGTLTAFRDRWTKSSSRGASTITMQLAAMVDPRMVERPRGTWGRKLAQARYARGIEARWTKQQILETYLNLLQFRGDLQGVGAAAAVLAGKAPSGLDVPESLVIAALLPSPGAKPDRVAARACARAQARGVAVDCNAVRSAADALLGPTRATVSGVHRAAHLARSLLTRPGERLQTTLDAQLQQSAHEILAAHLAQLGNRNVRDGAALVLDNASGEVLAYVGSAGPASRSPQVDGVRARRQAGSTLKPFLYELALERRLLTAASLLDDSPVHLETANGLYLPQDYDRNFKGLVSVRTALASSLNIPAVRALVLVGVGPFRDRLHALGYGGISRDPDYYGFSLALGSAEVSLWEQARAYRALALDGQLAPIRVRADATPSPATGTALLDPAASFVVADILSDRAARTLTFGLDNHLNTPYWSAAKTGTSKDMRDNWCIGFSQRFTVAVWVGNFEGDAMHDVSGVTGAAPAWQEIMAAAHGATVPGAPTPPTGVVAARTVFAPALEPARREWFLDGTQSERVAALTRHDEIARIASPANGLVMAIDPDIPQQFQRLPFLAEGAAPAARFVLDGTPLGAAGKGILWTPQAGSHRLVLEDARGAVLDQVRFIVR